MELAPTANGGWLMRGDTPHGRFSVEWDAGAELVSEHLEIRHPRRKHAPAAGASVPDADLAREGVPARPSNPARRGIREADASIIMTGRHSLDYLERTLPAVLAQGAGEVIVVDDADPNSGGKPAAPPHLESERVKTVRIGPPSSPSSLSDARDEGARAASGRVLAFVDADVLLAPNWLSAALAAMRGRRSVWVQPSGAPKTSPRDAEAGAVLIQAEAFHRVGEFGGRAGNEGSTHLYERLQWFFGSPTHYDEGLVRSLEHEGAPSSHSSQRRIARPGKNARPVRQAVVVGNWMTRGGAERVTLDILDALHNAGWSATLATTQRPPQGNHEWLPAAKADRVEHLEGAADIGGELSRLCAGAEALLINLSAPAYQALPRLGREQPGLLKMGIVHDEHSLGAVFQEQHHHLDRLITVSARLAGKLVEIGVPAHKIVARRWGVDTERYKADADVRQSERKRLGVADDQTLVLWVGRLAEGKRPGLAIKAIKHAPSNAKLVIVGEGGEARTIERLVEDYDLHERVVLFGGVEDERLPGLCNAADVALLTSKMEACPLVLQEAMACGTPVVAADVGAVGELVLRDCGVLIDSEDPADFGIAVEDVLRQKKEMGRASRRRIVEGFDLAAVKQDVVRLFEEPRRPTAGVLTAADPAQFEHARMLIESLNRSNPALPMHVVAYRLSQAQRDDLQAMGAGVSSLQTLGVPAHVVEAARPPHLYFWLKPWAIAAAPFDRVIWLDADTIVLRPLNGLLDRLDEGPVFTPDRHGDGRNPPGARGPIVNAGVMALERHRDARLVALYRERVEQGVASGEAHQWVHQDQVALREVLHDHEFDYQVADGWNEPPNGLSDPKLHERKHYPRSGWLDRVSADHPGAGVVHWANRPKLPELLGPLRYAIVSSGRSGSTMLRLALDAHPQCACLPEATNPGWEHGRHVADYHKLGGREYLRRHVWARAGDEQAFGFKYNFELLGREALVADRRLSVILLRRENILEKVASEWMANMVGFWDVDQRREAWRELMIPPMPPELLRRQMKEHKGRYDKLDRQFRGHRRISVAYERLIADPAEWRRITDFLKLDPSPWDPPTVKQETRPMHEVFANFDELAEHFAGTRWGWMFESNISTPGH